MPLEKLSPHIIVFAKFPLPGKVKTRLAKESSDVFATGLYRCFVHDLFMQLSLLNVSLELSLGFEHNIDEINEWIPQQKIITFQYGTTLGDRMINAFKKAFSEGHEHVILIGSDAPDLPLRIYKEALTSLQSKDICIGPSSDGGYYLIGFTKKSFTERIFNGIHWSTSRVFEESLARIQEANLSCATLPTWVDNDEMDDVITLYSRLKESPNSCPTSLAFLQTHLPLLPSYPDQS